MLLTTLVTPSTVLHRAAGVVFQHRFGDLADQRDRAAINREPDIVEDPVIRQRDELVPDLLDQLAFVGRTR